ncbi:type II toxin-antitoxin system RelE/ParE family toxin [Streptomyces californicus]|uniref:type II toxin-antitoxin system RelE/ParE family toxin n=1 Tax=Streptomyces TaxID=1883 RepID=UPI0018FF9940|nr:MULTISPECIES: type II toxin-antitoxin system RelE/ParE family toxin [Streptomyces]MBK0376069.1 type II toxin-antitoxin system RelE/ParE family toxin [Streptomyces sp. RB110-1]MBK0387557.1 type II toxin-antitoxin system RelE/ParE family toxin [Streptomyces sp. RB110-2]MDW4897696.1 type II toxin-antitoxin system RelE/ParE family toxin [Streptomyces californicus]
MNWEINLHSSVELWLLRLAEEDPVTADLVEAAVDMLAEGGPSLGRPLVDRLQGCRIHNLKELRPASSGRSEVRILFVFDPSRKAILLVAGDKAGRWSDWYHEAIPVAERRYDEYRAASRAPRNPGGVR